MSFRCLWEGKTASWLCVWACGPTEALLGLKKNTRKIWCYVQPDAERVGFLISWRYGHLKVDIHLIVSRIVKMDKTYWGGWLTGDFQSPGQSVLCIGSMGPILSAGFCTENMNRFQKTLPVGAAQEYIPELAVSTNSHRDFPKVSGCDDQHKGASILPLPWWNYPCVSEQLMRRLMIINDFNDSLIRKYLSLPLSLDKEKDQI